MTPGLRGEELAPARPQAARRGIETGIVQDLPHGGRDDAMAEPDQLALHPPVSQPGSSTAMPITRL